MKKTWHFLHGLMGVCCIVLWIALFVAGLFVNSAGYRDIIGKQFSPKAFGLVCILYTPTNAAILTCLAGLAGGISSVLTYHGRVPPVQDPLSPAHKAAIIRTENPFASMLRSFVVYLLFVAGLAIASPQNPFSNPTPDQYLRFAGILSVLGFVVGYDPSVFNSLLQRIPWTGSKNI